MHVFRTAALSLALLAAWPAAAEWQSPLDRDHPLAGRVWDVAGGRFADADEVTARAATARFVLLGETHDNPDHHRLQARLVEAAASDGRAPLLVWEMIGRDRQGDLDRGLATGDADAVAEAVDCAAPGGPEWSMYRPIAAAALAAGLPMRAAGLERELVRGLAMQGAAVPGVDLSEPLPDAVREGLLDAVERGHCGLMPRDRLAPFVAVQRARDAILAGAMMAAGPAGAVLIAGTGHVRRDIAVPWHLAQAGAGGDMLVVALLEVQPGETDPATYRSDTAGGPAPFDYLWFTPRADDTDHCAELRERYGSPAKP